MGRHPAARLDSPDRIVYEWQKNESAEIIMMRPAPLLVLSTALLASTLLTPNLLTVPAQAAETLNNKTMDQTYIPETTPCLPDKDKNTGRGCNDAPVGALEDKVLRDAEQQNAQQQLNNPNLNNPDALPPPSQLPPPEFSPQQQQLIEQIRHLPGQI